jgi:hypothetical protein
VKLFLASTAMADKFSERMSAQRKFLNEYSKEILE